VCRLVPLAFWGAWLIPILSPELFVAHSFLTVFTPDFGDDLITGLLVELLLMLASAAYLLLVVFALPSLIFNDGFPRLRWLLGYILLTVVTAGLGSSLWYLVKVDPILCQMAEGGPQGKCPMPAEGLK
jgi:hypothetical protein